MLDVDIEEFIDGEDIPNGFLCPISQEIMRDPVIAENGFSYERSDIQQWFDDGNSLSPDTGLPLKHKNLVPNINLKKSIQDWLVEHSIPKNKEELHTRRWMDSAKNGNKEAAKKALSAGANPLAQDKSGNNAFHLVCFSKDPTKIMMAFISMLPKKKEFGDLDEKDEQNRWHNLSVKRQLFEQTNKNGDSVLHVATQVGSDDLVLFLINQSACAVNGRNKKGDTALHQAVKAKKETIALCLIRAGADIYLTNNDEKHPVDLARGDFRKIISKEKIDLLSKKNKEKERLLSLERYRLSIFKEKAGNLISENRKLSIDNSCLKRDLRNLAKLAEKANRGLPKKYSELKDFKEEEVSVDRDVAIVTNFFKSTRMRDKNFLDKEYNAILKVDLERKNFSQLKSFLQEYVEYASKTKEFLKKNELFEQMLTPDVSKSCEKFTFRGVGPNMSIKFSMNGWMFNQYMKICDYLDDTVCWMYKEKNSENFEGGGHSIAIDKNGDVMSIRHDYFGFYSFQKKNPSFTPTQVVQANFKFWLNVRKSCDGASPVASGKLWSVKKAKNIFQMMSEIKSLMGLIDRLESKSMDGYPLPNLLGM